MNLSQCPKCQETANKCLCYLWFAKRRPSYKRIPREAPTEEKKQYLLTRGWSLAAFSDHHYIYHETNLELELEQAFEAQYEWDGYNFEDWIDARVKEHIKR